MSENEIVPSPPPEPPVPVGAAPPPVSREANELKGFSDVPLRLAIEIGQVRVSVGALRSMKAGVIFKLPKAAGEPFDISANGQPVARGEVIVVENSSGVRLTEILKL